MAPETETDVLYWDSSAVLSALIRDAHSDRAWELGRRPAVHLLSTLAYAETCAVIERLAREESVPEVLIASAHDALVDGPWRRLSLQPDWELMRALARKWALRGADLWHMATALTLHRELPTLQLLSFDNRLAVAAQGENLGSPTT